MENIKEVVLGFNKEILEFTVLSPQIITIIGKKGCALARRRSTGKIDEGDIVFSKEKFIVNCKRGDEIIINLVCDYKYFIGEVSTN